MTVTDSQDRYFDPIRETMDWNRRLETLQDRFLAVFNHAREASRAYRDIFERAGVSEGDVRGLDDLPRLPVVRMSDLVERQRQEPPFGGFETCAPEDIRRVYANPGLIWQPGAWEYDDTSWAEGLCAGGFQKGDRVVNTFNYHLWPFAFILDESAKMIGMTILPTGVGNTMMQVNIMHQYGVNGFLGTPSFLNTLIQRAEAMDLDIRTDLALERAMVGAEMLPESLRTRLEEKVGMTIRQTYGTVFLGCLGYECRHKTGLHVPDNVLVEIVDPQTGQPVPPGTPGEIVATNFNRMYPLLRFATGDLSLAKKETCPCGRTGPLLAKVLGRVDQATKVRGTFIHPWQFDEVMGRYPEIFKYQVIVTREEDVDVMTLVVEPIEEPEQPGILQGRIERDIVDYLTIKGKVKIVPRGSIPDFHKKIEDRRSWE